MKKIFGFLMAVAVLFTTSCAKEDISSNIATGDAVEVTFTANLPELGTRAYGDGLTATNLQYYVYEQNTDGTLTPLPQLCEVNGVGISGSATVNLALIKGMTYTITFWAANAEAPYSFYGKNVEINYDNVAANNEKLDAFYGVVTDFNPATATNDDTKVELTRPFAQLNAITTDCQNVKLSGITKILKSSIKVKRGQLNDKFNLLTGEATCTCDPSVAEEWVSFTTANIPAESNVIGDTTTDMHLAMNYLLVNGDKSLIDVEFSFIGEHNSADFPFTATTYTNIPVQRNYKTNIIGKLLTKATEFNVEIKPAFGGEEEYKVVEVATADDLQTALNNANVAEIVLTTDLTLDGTLTFGAPAATRAAEALPGRNFVIDGNGNTLKVVKAGTGRVIDFTSATNGASLTLKNLTIENNVSWIERIVNYNTTGTLTIDNVKIINAKGCELNYAINLPASSDESTVVINNSEIWANAIALNLWGEKTTANITNSKLYVVDNDPTEGYSVIALNNGGENAAHNSVVNIEGGEVKVIYEGEGETQPSSALRDATNSSEINISGTEVVGEMKLPVANVLYEGYDQFYSFTTLGAAIAKAQEDNNGTVCLIKDIIISEPINIAANDFQVVIDLNGKTINADYVEGSETNHVYAFENYGNIKITGNGTINARGIFNYGALTLENGTINAIDGNGGYAIRNYKGATFTMNGGTIATTLEDDNKVDKGGYDATTLRVDEGATAVINGGTISNICDFTFAIENRGNTTVKAGTFTSIHTNTANYGTLTIEGGSFTCNGLEGVTAHALWAAEGTATIKGGTFNGKDNYNGFNVDASEGATVIIKGGNFLPVHSGSLYGEGTITVSGGTFFDEIPAKRLAPGYESVKNTDGTFTATFFPTNVSTAAELLEAVANVKDGDLIVLNANITFTEDARTYNSGSWYDGLYYIGDKSFTIDLGGYTINQNGAVNDYLLNFKNDGEKANTITLKNGTVNAGTAAFCALCTSGTSTQNLTINTEDINFINNNSNGATLKIRGAKTTVNIKAGTVITGVDSYLCIESSQATVNIYDGAELYQNGTTSYNGCLVGVSGNGFVNVYGGYGKGKKGGFIAMTSGGTINVAGGEWIANTDGTIGNNSNLYVLTAQNNKYESGYAGASIINVTGGTFRGGMDAWILNDANIEKAELNISGGNFNTNPKSYLDEGKTVTEANGIWTVQ